MLSRRSRFRGVLLTAGAMAVFGLVTPGKAAAPPVAYDLGGGTGQVDYAVWGTIAAPNTPAGPYAPIRYDYVVYKPAGWKKSDHLPLYVLLHGCGTTANQMMGSTLLNRVADRERFLVVYPDNEGTCWHAVSEDAYTTGPVTGGNVTRGRGGDADIVAGITRRVTKQYSADADRVYIMGMSSGAFQSSATGAAYPDLYAAVGQNAGGGPGMSTGCLAYTTQVVPAYARAGVSIMGARAHLMPFFGIGGTGDGEGEQSDPGGCTRLAYMEWLYINNILKPAAGAIEPGASVVLPAAAQATANSQGRLDTFQQDPASTTTGQVANGWPWTRNIGRNASGCQISEEWVVDGMGHYWSGGSTDPKYTDPQPTNNGTGTTAPGFNDPKGPSASELSWAFFKQFSLKHGNTKCRL